MSAIMENSRNEIVADSTTLFINVPIMMQYQIYFARLLGLY